MESHIEIKVDRERIRPTKSEVERLLADNHKAMKMTGWYPLYAGREGLLKALKETVTWFTKPENLRLYKTDIYNI